MKKIGEIFAHEFVASGILKQAVLAEMKVTGLLFLLLDEIRKLTRKGVFLSRKIGVRCVWGRFSSICAKKTSKNLNFGLR